jgi:hypothetical protein
MSFVGFRPFQIEEVQERLRKMSDAELIRFGRASARMSSPEANFGHPPRRVFVEQLQEAHAEWWRRHSTPTRIDGIQ